jgi:hypothetical protein
VIVVSDTSPVTSLTDVGEVDLLRLLFTSVLVPREVQRELERGSVNLPNWIDVRDVQDRSAVARLGAEIDPGEAEALVLAIELKAERVLIDEAEARKVAARLGLRFVGVLGVLLEAKDRGHLPAVRPVLDKLVQTAGFWLSDDLYRRTVEAAGEK